MSCFYSRFMLLAHHYALHRMHFSMLRCSAMRHNAVLRCDAQHRSTIKYYTVAHCNGCLFEIFFNLNYITVIKGHSCLQVHSSQVQTVMLWQKLSLNQSDMGRRYIAPTAATPLCCLTTNFRQHHSISQ